MDKLLLTIEEVGDSLGLKHSTICLMLKTGELPSVKIGKCRRIPTQALKAYVERLVSGQKVEAI